jgi:hypothetical protein
LTEFFNELLANVVATPSRPDPINYGFNTEKDQLVDSNEKQTTKHRGNRWHKRADTCRSLPTSTRHIKYHGMSLDWHEQHDCPCAKRR